MTGRVQMAPAWDRSRRGRLPLPASATTSSAAQTARARSSTHLWLDKITLALSWTIRLIETRGWRRCTGRAGTSRSTKRTAAQAAACTSAASPPKIAVAALLQLAQWCQARHTTQHGGAPCPTTSGTVCPPASSGDHAAATADATLGATRTRPATGTVPGAQSVGGAPSSPSARQGGEA